MSSQKTEDNKNEIEYYDKIGNLGIDHTLNKQFSENDGGRLLTEFALVLMLLPKPPLKILDLGCGTGWTSFFLAKCGYDVIGVDLSPLAIYHANIKKRKTGLTNIKFEEGNYEDLNYKNHFDCVLFFSSLHHCQNYQIAIESAYNALKDYGICITCEPGKGHSNSKLSRAATNKYQVTELDMPPKYIIKAGKIAGFKPIGIYPNLNSINRIIEHPTVTRLLPRFALDNKIFRDFLYLIASFYSILNKRNRIGIVKLEKGKASSNISTNLMAKLNIIIQNPKIKENEPIEIQAIIKNTSRVIWLPTSISVGAVHLGIHLLSDNGDMIDQDFFRQKISAGEGRPIPTNEVVNSNFVLLPPTKGQYILEFDMVAEGVCWFSENGSVTIRIPIIVS